MFNIIFLDNNLQDLQRTKEYLESVQCEIKYDVNIEYCHEESQMFQILNAKTSPYDIFVTDIKMRNLSGIDIARKIRDEQKNAIVIFMTSYTKYVYQSFEYAVFRYIRKDHMNEELLPALQAACEKLAVSRRTYIIIKNTQGIQKVKSSDIMYFELENRKCIIYTREERIEAWKNITQLKNELGEEVQLFIEVYRGCLVNKKHIKKVWKNENKLVLDNNIELPISRRKKKVIEETMANYWNKHK